MLEDPITLELTKAGSYTKIINYLKKRASIRIVADLFRVTPQQVAEVVTKSWTMPRAGEPDEKPLWAKGKGAW